MEVLKTRSLSSQTSAESLCLGGGAVVGVRRFALDLAGRHGGVLVCLGREDRSEITVTLLWRWRARAERYLREARHLSLISYVAALGGFVTGVLN